MTKAEIKKKKGRKMGYSLLITCALGNVNRIDIRKKKRSIFLHHLIMNNCRHTQVCLQASDI